MRPRVFRLAGLLCLALLPAALPAAARAACHAPSDRSLGWATFVVDGAGAGIVLDGQGNLFFIGTSTVGVFQTTPGAVQPVSGAIMASYAPSGRVR